MTRLKELLRQLGGSFLDLLLPRLCAGCKRVWLLSHEGYWCRGCLDELAWVGFPRCPRCGRPFPKSPGSPDHPCGECISGRPPFDTARSAVIYAGVVRERIHQLKFGAQLHWVPPLVELLAAAFEKDGPGGIDFIVPVPLHVKRLRQRGFNQAGLLAKVLGKRIGLPVRFDLLARRWWTEPQTRLNRRERLENVKDAFGVVLPGAVQGRTILLIDDVFTTGTTLSECAKALKVTDAAGVHALTVARALPGWKPDNTGLS